VALAQGRQPEQEEQRQIQRTKQDPEHHECLLRWFCGVWTCPAAREIIRFG
jgi:hypothetical protein